MLAESPVILWIEDRPLTVENQIEEAKRIGFRVLVRAAPQDVLEVLSQHNVAGVVVDIMLWGVQDLSAIGLEAEATDTRDGLFAGWIFLEFLLRSRDPQFSRLPDIPVLVLSSRELGDEGREYLDRLRGRNRAPIDYVEKGMSGWTEQVSQWFASLQISREGE